MVNIKNKQNRNLEIIRKTAKPIFFVGMMGCGKSTIGRMVAQRLGYDFLEMDSMLENKLGMSIPQIFTEKGEDYFRTQENNLLDELLSKQNTIVSCGGGTFVNAENISKINNAGISVFLNVASNILQARLQSDTKRPLLQADSNGEVPKIGNILLKRIPFYTQANVMVDITVTNIEKNILQTIKEIARYLA